MTGENYPHEYHVGDSVLVLIGNEGAAVPGVIEAEENGRFQVSLSQAWVDQQSDQTQDSWFSPEQLQPDIGGDNVAGELPG